MQIAITSASSCIVSRKEISLFLDDKWADRFLALWPLPRNTNCVKKYLASRLREIRKKVNCIFISRPKVFFLIILFSWASELSRDFSTTKIVYSREKTDALEGSLRRNDDTVRWRTYFSNNPNNFSPYFSFTAICCLSCFSLSCGFKNSDNSWHLIGHFCKKSTIQNKYPSVPSRRVEWQLYPACWMHSEAQILCFYNPRRHCYSPKNPCFSPRKHCK